MKGRRRGQYKCSSAHSQFGFWLRWLANTNSRTCARDKEHQYPLKAQVVPKHSMPAYSGSRGTAPLILNPGTKRSSVVQENIVYYFTIGYIFYGYFKIPLSVSLHQCSMLMFIHLTSMLYNSRCCHQTELRRIVRHTVTCVLVRYEARKDATYTLREGGTHPIYPCW